MPLGRKQPELIFPTCAKRLTTFSFAETKLSRLDSVTVPAETVAASWSCQSAASAGAGSSAVTKRASSISGILPEGM